MFVRMHPNLVFLWQKGRNLQAMSITGDCQLATPINFIRGHLGCRKIDSFGLVFVFSSLGFVQMAGDHVLGLRPLCSRLAYFTNMECVHSI